MEQIPDRTLLARLLQGQPFADCFDTLPAGLFLRRYEKGELLNAPFRPQHVFLLVLQGKTRIYGVREDGSDFSVSMEERVLTFLREVQADHVLHSVNEGISRLHCSRSQLQRVLRRLCADGTLQKTGKGEYRLCRF